ncbi:hypothetical protein PR048_006065 [Dryococelus australis]|uniref:Uncharacterized protein n=1 Tax=Dryococelus australis TaxID=614101 RepID=A0ABQ9IAI7_9NEOP|nr:hypothetical protein PR048_006065 [Dryococelus australis]
MELRWGHGGVVARALASNHDHMHRILYLAHIHSHGRGSSKLTLHITASPQNETGSILVGKVGDHTHMWELCCSRPLAERISWDLTFRLALVSGNVPVTLSHHTIIPPADLFDRAASFVGKCRKLSGSGTQSGSVCNAQCDALLVKRSADLVPRDSEAEGTNGLMLFVNKQLEALISFVVQILQQVNPVKVDDMVKLARNPSSLLEMVKKPNIQQFLSFLKGKSITSSYSSFRKICRKVCISACSSADNELPMKIAPSAKHVLSLNMMFDDSLKMLRNVLTVVRRNIHLKKGFDKDKIAIMRPEEMANVNITKSFLEKKTSLLNSSASSRSNSTPFSASGTTAISVAADNSQSARSTERLSNSGKTSSSGRVAPEKQNMQTSFNNSRVSSKFQKPQTKNISNDQRTNKTSDESHDKLLQGASPKGANFYRQSNIKASNPDYLPKRVVVTAGEMGKRCPHEILEDMSSSQSGPQGMRDTQAQTCLTDAGDLDKHSTRHSIASGQFQQSIANFRVQELRKASAEPPAIETVKFRGYNAAKLKVFITDKETDKKFEHSFLWTPKRPPPNCACVTFTSRRLANNSYNNLPAPPDLRKGRKSQPYLTKLGRGGRAISTLASHQSESGSIPGRVTEFSYVGIVPEDDVGWRGFFGISRFPRPYSQMFTFNTQ